VEWETHKNLAQHFLPFPHNPIFMEVAVALAPVTRSLLNFALASVYFKRRHISVCDGGHVVSSMVLAKKGKLVVCSSRCVCTYILESDTLRIVAGEPDTVRQVARNAGVEFEESLDDIEALFAGDGVDDADASEADFVRALQREEAESIKGAEVDFAFLDQYVDVRTFLQQARVILANDYEALCAVDTDPRFMKDGAAHQELVQMAVAQAQRPCNPLLRYSISNGAHCCVFSIRAPGISLRYMYAILQPVLAAPLPTLSGDGPTYLAPRMYDLCVPLPGGGSYNPLDHPLVLAAMQQRILREEVSRRQTGKGFDFEHRPCSQLRRRFRKWRAH